VSMICEDRLTTGRERRRQVRNAINLDGRVSVSGRSVSCKIHNISKGGALIDAIAAFRIDDKINFEIPEYGALTARVVGVTSTSIAMTFEDHDEASLDTFISARLEMLKASMTV
jgi:hypothetical protein